MVRESGSVPLRVVHPPSCQSGCRGDSGGNRGEMGYVRKFEIRLRNLIRMGRDLSIIAKDPHVGSYDHASNAERQRLGRPSVGNRPQSSRRARHLRVQDTHRRDGLGAPKTPEAY